MLFVDAKAFGSSRSRSLSLLLNFRLEPLIRATLSLLEIVEVTLSRLFPVLEKIISLLDSISLVTEAIAVVLSLYKV
jgi:hypothetical protein